MFSLLLSFVSVFLVQFLLSHFTLLYNRAALYFATRGMKRILFIFSLNSFFRFLFLTIDFYILLLKTKIKIIEGRRELRYSRNTTKIDFLLIFDFLKTPNGIRNVDFYILLLNTRNLA